MKLDKFYCWYDFYFKPFILMKANFQYKVTLTYLNKNLKMFVLFKLMQTFICFLVLNDLFLKCARNLIFPANQKYIEFILLFRIQIC